MSAETRLQDAARKFTSSNVNVSDLKTVMQGRDNPIAKRLLRGANGAVGSKLVSVTCFALRAALGQKGTVETLDVLAHFDSLIADDPDMIMKDNAEFLYGIAQTFPLDTLVVTDDELNACGMKRDGKPAQPPGKPADTPGKS